MVSSLLDPRVRAQVGHQIHESRGTVSRESFQRWAAAVGDLNPVYFELEAALSAGYRDVVMPPLYISSVCAPISSSFDLKPDGSLAVDPMESAVLPTARLMAAGEGIEILAPVYGGDEIVATCSIADVAERDGSQGPFVLVTFSWEYRNQDGILVSRTRTSIIAR